MRFLVLCLLLTASVLAQDVVGKRPMERVAEWIRREVPWGQWVSLADYGGTPIEVSVRSREMTFISVDIADYTRMVPVIVSDSTIYGPSRVVMKPTRITRRVEKKDGVPFPGSRASMYLLYRDEPSGIDVFFLDEVVGQNRDLLVLRVPKNLIKDSGPPLKDAAPVESDRQVVEERSAAAAPRLAERNDGYLSDELLDWYLRLQELRDSLDVKDSKAVARFNEEAARYHEAVKKEREQTKR